MDIPLPFDHQRVHQIYESLSGWWFGCHQFYFPRNIGNVIIPIDDVIFFRGVVEPPTSYSWRLFNWLFNYAIFCSDHVFHLDFGCLDSTRIPCFEPWKKHRWSPMKFPEKGIHVMVKWTSRNPKKFYIHTGLTHMLCGSLWNIYQYLPQQSVVFVAKHTNTMKHLGKFLSHQLLKDVDKTCHALRKKMGFFHGFRHISSTMAPEFFSPLSAFAVRQGRTVASRLPSRCGLGELAQWLLGFYQDEFYAIIHEQMDKWHGLQLDNGLIDIPNFPIC